jgi:hypothetical protein
MGFKNKTISNNYQNSIQDKVSQIDTLSDDNLEPIEHTPTGKKSRLTVSDYYQNIFTNMTIPVSEQYIARLSQDLIKWAVEDDEALKLTQFFRKIGMYSRTFYRWCEKYPVLQRARVVATEAIGDRREILALKNKLNSGMVMSQMAKYDESWKNLEQWRADLRAKAQQKHESDITYKIVVDSYEDDDSETDNLPTEE